MTSDNKSVLDDLSNVVLEFNEEDNKNVDPNAGRKIKSIRHFSDGKIIEYEDDDEDSDSPKDPLNTVQVDPKSLTWGPWTWHQTSWLCSKVLNGCDYAGETLANFLGITAPKYQFEINEYHRIKRAEDEEKAREDREMAGWNERYNNNSIHMTNNTN